MLKRVGNEALRWTVWTAVQALGVALLLHPQSMQAQLTCPGDPSRTIFAGGPGDGRDTPPGACRQFDGNQTLCNQAFHLGGDGIASCYYDNGDCLGCGPGENEDRGECTNTCAVPTCAADPTRTDFVGGPDTEACHQHDNDQTSCLKAFHRNNIGGYDSCWFDANNDECRGCGPNHADAGDCTNTCITSPTCEQDPTRTIFAGGPRDGGDDPAGACRQFDDDAQMCNQAFHLGGDGIYSSCFPTTECDRCGGDRGLLTAPARGGAGQGDSNGPEPSGCINSCVPAPTCADQTRTTFAGGPRTAACQTFNGNQSACNAAYHDGDNGVATCWYDVQDGECLGCGPSNESDGECTNTCIANTCPLDATRTTFAGGPSTGNSGGACRQFQDQTSCEQAFHRGRDGIASCYWTGSECLGCGFANEVDCVNTCAPLPPCVDATRTNFVGGSGDHACQQFDGQQAACLTAYHRSSRDIIASCWYDTNSNECRGCGPNREDDGVCSNTCQPTPTCALDATRTIFVGGPGTDACEEFDNDQTNCEKAFHRTRSGAYTSCFYNINDDDCRGCGPENQSDGDCTNTCGALPTCAGRPTFGDCDQFDGNATACNNAFEATADGLVSCFSRPVCLGCGLFNQSNAECTNTCEAASATEVAPAPALSWHGLLIALFAVAGIGLYRLRAQRKPLLR